MVSGWCSPRRFSIWNLGYQRYSSNIYLSKRIMKNIPFRYKLMRRTTGRLIMIRMNKIFWVVPVLLLRWEIIRIVRIAKWQKRAFWMYINIYSVIFVEIYKSIQFLWVFACWNFLECFWKKNLDCYIWRSRKQDPIA